MSRQFVPVVDLETPRAERDDFDPNMAKHRKFDNPYHNPGAAKRGWSQGSVGWGVQGYFGSQEADSANANLQPRKFELVKDKFGRWINPNKKGKAKPRSDRDNANEAQSEQRGDTTPNAPSASHRQASSDDVDEFGRRRRHSPPRRGSSRSPEPSRRGRRHGPGDRESPERRDRRDRADHDRRDHRAGRYSDRHDRRDLDEKSVRGRHRQDEDYDRRPYGHGHGRDDDRERGRRSHERDEGRRVRSPHQAQTGASNASGAPKRKKRWDPEWGEWR